MSKILIAMFTGTLNENGERVLPAFYEYVVSQLKKKNDVFLFMHGMFGDIDSGIHYTGSTTTCKLMK